MLTTRPPWGHFETNVAAMIHVATSKEQLASVGLLFRVGYGSLHWMPFALITANVIGVGCGKMKSRLLLAPAVESEPKKSYDSR